MRTLLLVLLLASSGIPAATAATGNGVIAFVRNGHVLTVDPATGTERDLTVGTGPLSWSPDGSQLLYSTYVQDSSISRQIPMVMTADGGSMRALVDDPSQNWSPECWLGPDLAALRTSPLGGGRSDDFYVVHSDGSGLRALTSHFTTTGRLANAQDVCSPAADLVFFIRGLDWYSASADGALLKLPLTAGSVSPSPDGSHLAWMGNDSLFVTGIDGTNATKIADAPTTSWQYLGPAQWSPDGSAIAFPSAVPLCCSDDEPSYYSSVHVVSASGAGERAVTSKPKEQVVPLAWSPDGTRILFRSGFEVAQQDVFVINVDGSCRTRLFSGFSLDFVQGVAWQPVPGKAADPPISCADVGIQGDEFAPPFGLEGAPYSVAVTNDGNLPAADVRVTFTDFTALVPGSLETPSGSCDATSCLVGTVGPGETVMVTANLTSTNEVFSSYVLAQFTAGVSSAGTNSDDTNDSMTRYTRAYGCPGIGTYGPDSFSGTAGNDSYCGLPGADRILGRKGNDRLDGGPGRDVIYGGPDRDRISGGGENDVIYARDGQRDEIDCGLGRDVAFVDRKDSVADCEKVHRGRR
jgi:RTX calcium-binding nonapeptide repeat (4 copies)/WD40-like Beta Propeller Repeat